MSPKAHVRRICEKRKEHLRSMFTETMHVYTPQFNESCATCCYVPSERCSPQCRHYRLGRAS